MLRVRALVVIALLLIAALAETGYAIVNRLPIAIVAGVVAIGAFSFALIWGTRDLCRTIRHGGVTDGDEAARQADARPGSGSV